MLIDVLTDLASDTGLDLVQKRSTLLRLANKAAKQMHKELECNKIHREVTLVVPRNKVVSLPAFIGELVGMRMHTNDLPFDLHSIGQPRYTSNTLQYRFKNWRDLSEQPLHTLLSVNGQLTLTCSALETTNVAVKITGQTDKGSNVQESITMDATSKTTTNIFGPDINSIYCPTLSRTFDITILDANGIEVAILPTYDSKTRYKIVDVSNIFWSIDTTNDESLIDVCYKVNRTNLVNDADPFYTGQDDYDEAWYNLAMYMFLKPLQNRLQDAQLHRQLYTDFMQSAKSEESGIVKKVNFGRNKFYSHFNRGKYFYPGAITNVDRSGTT